MGPQTNLTPQVVHALGTAFARWLQERTAKSSISVAIGMDSRLSGPALKAQLLAGLTQAGISDGMRVLDCGLASTPAMFMACLSQDEHGLDVDGSIMLTASHLPKDRGGLKFFTKDGGLDKDDISELLAMAEELLEADEDGEGSYVCREVDYMATYKKHLVQTVREAVGRGKKPLAGKRIIVDAGNGAGGFFADVLHSLGADTTGSQFLEPDGNFPNHVPNPEDMTAMRSLQDAMGDADLGVIFDADVDRAAVVTGTGRAINRNRFLALIAAIVLQEHPGATIVTDSVTSSGLARFIAQRGGQHHRFKRGYKNVINEAQRLVDNGVYAQLAMETSGHGALRENHFLDDGSYLVVKVLIAMAKMHPVPVESLIADLEEPAESIEVRMTLRPPSDEDELFDTAAAVGQHVITCLQREVKLNHAWRLVRPNHEGVRIEVDRDVGNGWFLLRRSLHDPKLVLNIESDSDNGVAQLLSQLRAFFQPFGQAGWIDTAKLDEAFEAQLLQHGGSRLESPGAVVVSPGAELPPVKEGRGSVEVTVVLTCESARAARAAVRRLFSNASEDHAWQVTNHAGDHSNVSVNVDRDLGDGEFEAHTDGAQLVIKVSSSSRRGVAQICSQLAGALSRQNVDCEALHVVMQGVM